MNGDEVVIVGKDGAEHVFPAGFDPKRAAAIVSGGQDKPSSGGTLAPAATAASIPAAAEGLYRFGTNPNVGKMMGQLARIGTGVGTAAHGLATGNPSEVISSPIAAWSAGKGGYWLGKGLQSAARPIASALDAIAPYAAKTATPLAAMGSGGGAIQNLQQQMPTQASAQQMYDTRGDVVRNALMRLLGQAQ